MNFPLFVCHAGFPSPAEDMAEKTIDVASVLIPHPVSTFIAQVLGTSMVSCGIRPDDYLVVDRSIPVQSGDLVVARIGSGLVVKYFFHDQEQVRFVSADRKIQLIPADDDWEIWGKVAARFGFFA